MKKEKVNKEELNFALVTPSGLAINDIIDSGDYKMSNCKWVKWGKENKFPAILFDNYLKCSNLQAIINTITDYVYGEGIETNYDFLSDDGDTLEEVLKKCILDYILFGGFTLECIRNANGDIVMINYQNVMNVRVNEDLTIAYISNKWSNYNTTNIVELPLFNKDEKQPHFIFYFRGNITRGINPIPCYISALKSVEILNNTRNFHLRNLENGFSARSIINLNNGTIKTRELEEIKEKLEKGYCGTENAGKFILINGGDKEHETTITSLDSDKFEAQYKALQESSIDDVYVGFRINKMLVGVNIQTGFSSEEFENAYKLYYTTFIKPIQNDFVKLMKKLDINISFNEFKIDWKGGNV